MGPLLEGLLLVLVAFVPPAAYVLWVRNLERHEREPWGQVAKMFLWGATGGVFVALLLGVGILAALAALVPALGAFAALEAVSATFIAPVVEEPAKAAGLRWVRDPHPEPEDGLVYGAAAGLGFAATENLLYAYDAFVTDGLEAFLVVAAIRSVASAFLHAAASAIVGYGFLRAAGWKRGLPFLGLAILLHGLYNGLLSSGALLDGLVASDLLFATIGFFAALALSIATFAVVRRHVRRLDARPPPPSDAAPPPPGDPPS